MSALTRRDGPNERIRRVRSELPNARNGFLDQLYFYKFIECQKS
jgi:hypothetical protein